MLGASGGGSLPYSFQDDKPLWTMAKAGSSLSVH
jgi:hypothetical protein